MQKNNYIERVAVGDTISFKYEVPDGAVVGVYGVTVLLDARLNQKYVNCKWGTIFLVDDRVSEITDEKIL